MPTPFRLLDQVLRGEATGPDRIGQGQVSLDARSLLFTMGVLGVVFGACVGSYTPLREGGTWQQPLASGLKIPLLFGLTFLVTLPSLYVFSAIVGSRLSLSSVINLLLAMMSVALAVCASLGPIVVFFALSTDSYPFMLVLVVIASAVGGFLGLTFLLNTLHRLALAQEAQHFEAEHAVALAEQALAEQADRPTAPAAESDAPSRPHRGALHRATPGTDIRARTVFRIWVVVFALVGAQMSWVLRPFVGHPNLPFEWFRDRGGNFFQAVWRTVERLLAG
ncbi:MAG: hypothetical protein AB7I09_12730 [Planctomycetota bacterium]